MPTEPGLYVPAKNTDRLGQTNVYRLNEDGQWSDILYGDDPQGEKVRDVHTRFGLVRLAVASE